VILAGIILAEAAIRDGLNAIQTQSYGPESRGGASKAEVVVSDQEIEFPKVTNPMAVLVLTQEAHDKYGRGLAPGTVLVADSDAVEGPWPEGVTLHRVPIVRTAVEVTGRRLSTNIVALGVLVAATGVVSRDAVIGAVRARVPRGTEEANLKALEAGFSKAGGAH
jgi:2-oxoglutarate ferredoxin oxidoreductase subunit gamma